MQILMLLSNPFRPDPRVAREASLLVRAGHQVRVVCWDRRAELTAHEVQDGVEIVRIHSVKTVYGAGLRQLMVIPHFWRAAVRAGLELRPDVVHAHDLDTLYAAVMLKKRLGCKLVYDAHEDYPALMSLYLPRLAVKALAAFERRLISQADVILTASTVFADKLCKQGVQPVESIGNFQSLEAFDEVGEQEVQAERACLGIAAGDYVVAYIGGFSRNRELLPLIEAARQVEGFTLLLLGDGAQRARVEAACAGLPQVRYLGWLPAHRVPLYTRLADVLYYCLRPDYPGAEYNAPNSLSNAMAAGRPIIANRVGDLGRIVAETHCGVLLNEVNPQSIAAAIRSLKDPELRQMLGQNGLQAARTTYNWGTVGQNLLQIYANLLPGK